MNGMMGLSGTCRPPLPAQIRCPREWCCGLPVGHGRVRCRYPFRAGPIPPPNFPKVTVACEGGNLPACLPPFSCTAPVLATKSPRSSGKAPSSSGSTSSLRHSNTASNWRLTMARISSIPGTLPSHLQRNRGHGDIEPAGAYPAKGVELGRHVEGKSMQGDPVADMNSDGGDLSGHSTQTPRQAVVRRRATDPEFRQRSDQHLLELADEAVNVPPPGAQVDDRVAYDLAGTMVGDAASALDPVYRNPPCRRRPSRWSGLVERPRV